MTGTLIINTAREYHAGPRLRKKVFNAYSINRLRILYFYTLVHSLPCPSIVYDRGFSTGD